MSFSILHSKQPSAKPPPNEEGSLYAPFDNRWLLATSEGSSTIEAKRVYKQIEPRFSLVHIGPQPDNPVHEASGTESYHYNQPHVIGGHLSVTADQGKRIAGRGARPICGYCNKDFGRVQELNRHFNEQHMPPRRCPFCDFTWTRPNGMKAHLMVRHAEKFTAEMLEAIEALRGRRFIEFIDAYDHLLDLGPEATLQ